MSLQIIDEPPSVAKSRIWVIQVNHIHLHFWLRTSCWDEVLKQMHLGVHVQMRQMDRVQLQNT